MMNIVFNKDTGSFQCFFCSRNITKNNQNIKIIIYCCMKGNVINNRIQVGKSYQQGKEMLYD